MVPRHGPEVAVCDQALARVFDFLGKRWSGIIIGTLVHGSSSFSGLRRAIPAISESVLSDRLVELAEAGLIRREVHEGPPVSVSYSLTESGQGLVPALHQLTQWARDYLLDT